MALTPLKRAFLALEAAEARLAEVEAAAREPIAIIGAGCRVPGGANDLASYWSLMRDSRDAIGPIPSDRWDADALYDPDPDAPGQVATRYGGFLRDVDRFDAGFFGIAPREARGMDPQQRVLLEVSWEALEHAGQAADRLSGSATGVYVGATASDYTYLQLKSGDPALLDAQFTSGIAHSVLSGRLSYLLGLQGPSVTVDTACSSSLVAVHLACQALRGRECRMALAGGINLILSPDLFIALSHARVLAPDGRCKTFDAAADGFARGEGCGVIVLKRLGDARADGDRVLAVIRGSAVNNDGPSSGLTAPNGPAQEQVLREALARAGLIPGDIGFIEAHGTGTQLGDPIEVRALGAVFGPDRDPSRPLLVGSVKTNIGHLEAAAGVAGLLKIVLALMHRQIPAHLHFKQPNPHIPWDELPVRVPTGLMPWEPIGGHRRAGVSSFGFSGTNAHIVLEEAPDGDARPPRPGAHLFALSARDETAFAELAARHAAQLRPDQDLADVCFTATTGRAHFAYRSAVVARSTAELREALSRRVVPTHVPRRDPLRVAFLFTGQGAQYAGMAKGLYETAPAFRAALDRCAEILAPLLDRPLLDALWAADGPLDDTTYTQPALFAVEYALTELLGSWGIAPNLVLGHSVGEYVAACVAGVFAVEDALRLVAARGRLMGSLPAGGTMTAVFASEERVEQALAPYFGRVALAAVNGPGQAVISGGAAEVGAVSRDLAARGVRCQPLTVSHAFHSPLVEPILDEFEAAVAAVPRARSRLRLISNLSGAVADPDEVTRAGYWRRHAREAVRFGDGLRALAATGPDCVVEIGPNPTLLALAKGVFGDNGARLIPTLRKGRPDHEQMLEAQAALYLAGADIDWRGATAGGQARVVDLATYPFQRERHWFRASPVPADARGRSKNGGGHPLLGTRLRTASTEAIFEGRLTATEPAFVRHHRVLERIVVPATVYLEALFAAGRAVLGTDRVAVEDVTILAPMLLEEDGAARAVQLVATPDRAGGAVATLSSLAEGAPDDEPWTCHVTAMLRVASTPPADGRALDDARARCGALVTAESHYAGFERRGLRFGDHFKVVRRLWRGAGEAVGEVELGPELAREAGDYHLHPVLLDGCLQVLAAALSDDDALFLPIGIARFALGEAVVAAVRTRMPGRARSASTAAPGAGTGAPEPSAVTRCWSHVTVRSGDGETRRADVSVFTAGDLLAELRDVQLKRATRDALERLDERALDEALYEPGWRPAALADEVPIEQLAVAAGAALPGLRREAGLDAYDAFLPRFESRCSGDVARVMRDLGWTDGGPLDAAGLGVVPRHRRLFARLRQILDEPKNSGESEVALGEIPPGAEAEVELTDRATRGLAAALRGEQDPLELLFPGGSLATTERLYRDAPTARTFNGLIAEVIAAVVGRHVGGPLRILELGGGTGGTTVRVLPRLPGDGIEYTFTDVGPTFVARARARFGDRPFMRCEVLDLEREPGGQGFSEGAFDVVIAANVIHATADLRRTLSYVRRLLAPGGLFVMLEVTAPQRWFDLTVGLTEGWWAFSDHDLRPDYPTLPRHRWLALLAESGFEQAAALPGGAPSGALALQSLFLSRTARPIREWVIVADRGGLALALAAQLTARGDHCALSQGELPVRGVYGVIYARSLDEDDAVIGAVRVAQELVARTPAPQLWLLTRGAQEVDGSEPVLHPNAAAVWGLRRTIALEHPELKAVAVDLDPAGDARELDALVRELDASGAEPEVAFRRGSRHVGRLARLRRPVRSLVRPPVRLVAAERGSFDSLALCPLEPRDPGSGEVAIAVEATGLNFKDVLNVLGLYPGDPGPLGGECAGRVTAVGSGVTHVAVGDDVMAVAGGSFGSHVVARAELVQRRPAGMAAEEGASIPIAFLTAEFCLSHLARIGPGDRVLVHAAAGGVGMAAVRLARRAGVEVFATAGAPWKRDLLRALGARHVFDSRGTDFADEILAVTDGRGVDVVLNSLAGESIDASFRALARGGRFVEIGKRSIKDREWVEALDRGIAYHVVDWGETAVAEPALIGGLFARLVDEFRTGKLIPLPRHVFRLDAASRAFRFMAQARHAGKVVVRHGPPDPVRVRADGTYLITGGLSGLGLVVAEWLARHGAGRIVLVGRRGVADEAGPQLEAVSRHGARVVVETLDVTDAVGLSALLGRLRCEGPPLRGVVHSAGVLDNASLLQQDEAKFARVLAPKVRGGVLLGALTDGDPLDFFVLFSSAASVLGAPGQANHAAANAVLDVLARERRSRGRPGYSINWGPWSEVGAAAEPGITARLADQGIAALTIRRGLLALEHILGGEPAQVAVLPIDWRRYLGAGAGGPVPAFLSEVAGRAAPPPVAAVRDSASHTGLRERLDGLPPGRWRKEVAVYVHEAALRVLGIGSGTVIDTRAPLGEFGLDSLLAVELRNKLGAALGRTMPATLLFDYPTLEALTDHLLATLTVEAPDGSARADDRAARPFTVGNLVDTVADLSDDEVERRLADRMRGNS